MLKVFTKLEAALAAGLAAALIACMFCGEMQENVARDVLRLHIIANSDSAEDQSLKLRVRDALLDAVERLTRDAEDADAAQARAGAASEELQRLAQEEVRRAGYGYSVSLTLGEGEFPRKTYGRVTLPAGTYDAVRVVIGEGEGQNWWCVMYPALCTSADTEKLLEDSDISEKELRFITSDGKYELRFRLVEWYLKLRRMFGAWAG